MKHKTSAIKRAWPVMFALVAGTGPSATDLHAQALAPVALQTVRPYIVRLPKQPPHVDPWFGADKLRHAGSSAAIQLMGYGLMRIAGASRQASLVGATVVTAAAGIGKELRDAKTGGDRSVRDLVWDGVGVLAGTGLARLGDGR